MSRTFEIPELSLVVLIGASGSGKSTFAKKHFLPSEIVSSDYCRWILADDENDQSATNDAFELLHEIIRLRLKRGRLTVVDATNLERTHRQTLIKIAREYHVQTAAIILNLPESLCHQRNEARPDRNFGPHVTRRQVRMLRSGLRSLPKEGFRFQIEMRTPEEAEELQIVRTKLWPDKREMTGPFDIIGDLHGCYDELVELLGKLGWSVGDEIVGPEGRKVVFVGDLTDRGPKSPEVLRLVIRMVEDGHALCVPGNHDVKLVRMLSGKNVQLTHGLDKTAEQLKNEPPEFLEKVRDFLDRLVSHAVLDGGRLVVAHAGMKEEMQGRASGAVREFGLYGETTGEVDEFGLPVRMNWALDYRGSAMVVYGHTPVPEPEWLNGTINIDTGCVFGHRLTALRYPERELVYVPAQREYAEYNRPLADSAPTLTAQQAQDDLLEIEDVIGKRRIDTELAGLVMIREENAAAALEVMSRFAANPKWLIHLPPTMSPVRASVLENFLEHPDQAFDYYRNSGQQRVVCEEKHMGSRALAVVCRDEAAARDRFGVEDEGCGVIVTRTGRPFFEDKATEQALLTRVIGAMTRSGFWDEFSTNWALIDLELMPWSAKAQSLLRNQYAAVAAASEANAQALTEALAQAGQVEGIDVVTAAFERRAEESARFRKAYRQYCWSVNRLEDYKLAPFHLLATEDRVHLDQSNEWHMETLAKICREDEEILLRTPYRVVDLESEAEVAEASAWWLEMTEAGREGMVVKPYQFLAREKDGRVTQPALKVRGREYLRIIYGPSYDRPENLSRLRKRSVGAKRSLASREFALGIESLKRFIRKEPLRRVHECVFGVLALESEPIDPRL